MDALKKRDKDSVLHANFGGWFGDEVEGPRVPKMQDLIDFLALASAKGVDLKRLVSPVREVEVKEDE
jgi:hypothetical protein